MNNIATPFRQLTNHNASLMSTQLLGIAKRAEPVIGCRAVKKVDMKFNNTTPKVTVDPETFIVTADGVELRCEPAKRLPLTQRYYLY